MTKVVREGRGLYQVCVEWILLEKCFG